MPSSSPSGPYSPQGARDAEGRPAPVLSDQNLPPIEPPSAGFLLQLFVVPAVIVAGVVLVWFLIESLARSGEQDPAAIVSALRGANGFQQANDLADMLQIPERYPSLRTNRELATGMATYLDELVALGDDAESAITMRYILASLLGEMQVDDGLPALLKAARSDPVRDVRRRAINAIAVLAGSLARLSPPQYLTGDEREDLVDALVELANDKDELVRSEAAFAIGVVGAAPDADARLNETLLTLADDPYTDARFNAAIALSRVGSPLAAQAIAEIFDPEALAASLTGEKPITAGQTDVALRSQQAYKRNTILTSALAAVDMMVEQKKAPPAGMATLTEALAKFIAAAPAVQDPSPLPDEIVEAAQRALEKVRAPK